MESPAHCDQYDHQAAGTRERAAVAPLRFDLFFLLGRNAFVPNPSFFTQTSLIAKTFLKARRYLENTKKRRTKESSILEFLSPLSYPCFLPTCLVIFHMWILRFHIWLIKPLLTVPIIQKLCYELSNYFDLWYVYNLPIIKWNLIFVTIVKRWFLAILQKLLHYIYFPSNSISSH